MQRRRPVMLAILDGWGWREDAADNAVKQARTPNFDRLWASCPTALLRTSGKDVGLPQGQMGNSEVGHLNIGAGRVVMQDLPRIGDAIALRRDRAAAGAAGLHRLPQGERRHLPSDGPGVARRRAFAPGSRASAWRRSSPRPACRPWCTPGPMDAIRRRNRPATTSRASPPRCRSRSRSRPCAGATTRWTATSAGSASRKPTQPWSTRMGRASPMPAASSTRPMPRRNSTSSSSRRSSATIAACATATACCASISAPTACAKFSPRSSIRNSPALSASARSSSPAPSA